MGEAAPGAGDIPIELDGKQMVLRPTLDACILISGMAGGLNAAVQRCLALDMNTIVQVITAGLGLNPVQAKQVPGAAYRTGLIGLSAPCVDFIHVIGNGGRPPAEDDSEGEAADDGDADPREPAFP